MDKENNKMKRINYESKELQRIFKLDSSILLPVCYALSNVFNIYNSQKAKELLDIFLTKEISNELAGIGARWILKNNNNFAYWNNQPSELVFDYRKHEFALKMMYKNILDSDLIN